ncbi:uncharacterized protein [Zea mays]|uniref:Phosphoethanolamine/phosphocholine phosphatase n=1 Tax=Zea mays TaxID=4577 RepID=A0A1D6NLE5_MAIZE|nr:uncharacterized protein LOC100281893 isoform X5 [Zea mays]ONM41045.1 Phosphoethanolamine/phosphocholine phosphatase [Zea mays]|eukprot:XP_020405304.1 uncharacterized protein LOC100281893 isoform X5 [Zea mays]
MASASAPEVVVVFDFDRTIIDWDSDDWVITKLGAADAFQRLRPTMRWNPLMDRMMAELHARGKTPEDIRDCLRSAPLDTHVVSAVKTAAALGCDLKVVSDANTFFIETVLAHHGVLGCFSEIVTNPASVDADGRLRISPFHDPASAPHGCSLCPDNMCKSTVMSRCGNSPVIQHKPKMCSYHVQCRARYWGGSRQQAVTRSGAGASSTSVTGREITARPSSWGKGTTSWQGRTTPCGISSATTSSFSRLRFIRGTAARNWKRRCLSWPAK